MHGTISITPTGSTSSNTPYGTVSPFTTPTGTTCTTSINPHGTISVSTSTKCTKKVILRMELFPL